MPNKQTDSTKDSSLITLYKEISRTNKLLARQNSFRRNFTLSVVQGMGSALGATLVAGILVALFYQLLVSVNEVPFFHNLIPSSAADQFLQYTNGASASSESR